VTFNTPITRTFEWSLATAVNVGTIAITLTGTLSD